MGTRHPRRNPIKIGVGVEGPSDRVFWDKVLHKHFPRVRFDIHNMSNRGKLIRDAADLLETFRDTHCTAGFLLVDRDDTPCASGVIDEFASEVQAEARKPLDERYLFICVSIRELEAWFLADGPAITAVLPNVTWEPPKETGTLNAEKELKALWKEQHGKNVAFNKIEFAKLLAPKFKPDEAGSRSASFLFFWNRVMSKARR